MRIKWEIFYQSGSRYPWSLVGLTEEGGLWVEYVFACKPTKRQARRAKKGKGDATINVYF